MLILFSVVSESPNKKISVSKFFFYDVFSDADPDKNINIDNSAQLWIIFNGNYSVIKGELH